MFLSLTLYSQTDTADSVVILSKRVAIEVLKDLERLDRSDSIRVLNELKIEKLITQTKVQDRVILGQQEQIFNYDEIVANKDGIINVKDLEVDHWEKQYKKQRRQKFLVGGIGLVLIVLLAL